MKLILLITVFLSTLSYGNWLKHNYIVPKGISNYEVVENILKLSEGATILFPYDIDFKGLTINIDKDILVILGKNVTLKNFTLNSRNNKIVIKGKFENARFNLNRSSIFLDIEDSFDSNYNIFNCNGRMFLNSNLLHDAISGKDEKSKKILTIERGNYDNANTKLNIKNSFLRIENSILIGKSTIESSTIELLNSAIRYYYSMDVTDSNMLVDGSVFIKAVYDYYEKNPLFISYTRSNFIVKNNLFTNTSAIESINSNSEIKENTFRSNEIGIFLSNSNSIVSNNSFFGFKDLKISKGVVITDESNAKIENNNFDNIFYGVVVNSEAQVNSEARAIIVNNIFDNLPPTLVDDYSSNDSYGIYVFPMGLANILDNEKVGKHGSLALIAKEAKAYEVNNKGEMELPGLFDPQIADSELGISVELWQSIPDITKILSTKIEDITAEIDWQEIQGKISITTPPTTIAKENSLTDSDALSESINTNEYIDLSNAVVSDVCNTNQSQIDILFAKPDYKLIIKTLDPCILEDDMDSWVNEYFSIAYIKTIQNALNTTDYYEVFNDLLNISVFSDIQDRFIFKDILDGEDANSKLFVETNDKNESYLFYYDMGRFFSYARGLALTNSTLIWKNLIGSPQKITFDNINTVSLKYAKGISLTGWNLMINEDDNLTIRLSELSDDGVLYFLNSLLLFINSNRNSNKMVLLDIPESEQNILKGSIWERHSGIIIGTAVVATVAAIAYLDYDGQIDTKEIATSIGTFGVSVANKMPKMLQGSSKNISKYLGVMRNKTNTIVKSFNIAAFMKPNFKEVVQKASNNIGVYIFRKNGKVMYVGKATQLGKGLRKRLMEHFRGSSSGKKEIYMNRDNLNVTTIPLKSVDAANKMEANLIRQYDTVKNGWNMRYEN